MIVSDVASSRYVARGVHFLYSDLLYPSAEDRKGRKGDESPGFRFGFT